MRSTQKMDEIKPQKSVNILTLDCESLGKLIRAKALKAAAMHFVTIGVFEQAGRTLSKHNDTQPEDVL